jgi:hypothetical protein
MPWCPKCKAEYQEGFTVCADCNVELVDELTEEMDMVPFMEAEEKDIPEKLVSYFDFSGLKSSLSYDEEKEAYVVSVPSKKQKQAKKFYQAFLAVGSERKALEEAEQLHGPSEDDGTEVGTDEYSGEEEETSDNGIEGEASENPEEEEEEDSLINPREESSVYVMKADRYKDLRDTVIVFLLFGIVGLFVVLLNIARVFTFLSGVIPNLVLGLLFLFFIYVGLSTNKKAKQIQSEIVEENKLTEKINLWLKKNVTDDFLESLKNDKLSEEVNYMRATEVIRKMLIKEFGEQNSSYLDRLVDEFYSSNFDNK